MQLKDLTIEAPLSATQHGNRRIFCTRGPRWKDALSVVTFFATNYISHAATVKSTPGEGTTSLAFNTFLALCFPMFGLLRALNAIARGARFGGSELRNACRAGALCMVVRNREWRPQPRDHLKAVLVKTKQPDEENSVASDLIDAKLINYFPTYAREDSSAWAYFDTIGSRAYVDPDLTRIHGTYSLSKGYAFAIVPRNACLMAVSSDPTPSTPHRDNTPTTTVGINQISETESKGDRDTDATTSRDHDTSAATNQSTTNADGPVEDAGYTSTPTRNNGIRPSANSDISSSYSIAKTIASLVQVLGALSTLLLHKSDVVERWGYASFHLTVIPYIVMTVVNFISNTLTADYACLYMVESELMREARKMGSKFEGTVAALEEYSGTLSPDTSRKDITSWTGFKLKHVKQIAGFLSGEWLSNFLFGGNWRNIASNESVSSIELRCDDPVEIHSSQSESTMQDGRLNHQISTNTLQRNSDIELERLSGEPPATGNETSRSLRADERVDSDIPSVNQVQAESDAEEPRRSNLNKAPAEPVLTLTSLTEGHRYRIKEFRRTKWLDREFLLGGDTSQEGVPQFTPSPALYRFVVENSFSFYAYFSMLDPIRLRLAASVKQVEQESTGTESWKTLLSMLYRSLSGNSSAASSTGSTRRKPPKPLIYVPNCLPFNREGKDKGQAPRGRGNAGLMMIFEVFLGCSILGALIVFVGWLSHWFSHGQSSRTERAIIMLWMAEGAFGLLLPLLSLKELIMVFLLLPLYAILLRQRRNFAILTGTYIDAALQYIYLIAFLPAGIFVAPFWGFVIVGRQLVEWGNCVSLY